MTTLKIDRTGSGSSEDDVLSLSDDGAVGDDAGLSETGEPMPGLPGCVLQADGSITLALAYPFPIKTKDAYGVIKEQQHTRLVLHRLKGEHLIRIRAASGQQANVAALACALRMPDLVVKAMYDRMDAIDLETAALVIENFTQAGRMTGR